MKVKSLALSLLLASCAVIPPHKAPNPIAVPNQNPSKSLPIAPGPQPASSQSVPEGSLLSELEQATAKVTADATGDRLSLQVIIQKPESDFKIQQLELSKIQNLRSWVEGPGLPSRILNLNNFVSVNDQNQQTELVISEVPRGKHRVVTVQGYQQAQQDPQQQAPQDPAVVPGATLKAVYDSPANSTNVVLTFTWRSTAYANIVEKILAKAEAAGPDGEPTQAEILALLDNLNTTELNTFLDAVIFGTNPTTGTVYNTHPDRLDPEKIATLLIEAEGTVPTHNPQDPVPNTYLDETADLNLKVQTPKKVPFSNSQIQVQITDPASDPIVLTVGSDTGNVPKIVPGNWEALVKLDGLNGGVSTRATLEVDSNGNAILTEGTPLNPIILPPVITAIDKTNAGAGDQITLTGDGFDPDKVGNIVKFGDTVATVVSATATQLVVEVPVDVSGKPKITVTSQGKTGNFAELDIDPRFISLDKFKGDPDDLVTLTVSGYDPSQVATTVRFNGSAVDVVPESATSNTITVRVPQDATTGTITLKPTGLNNLNSPVFTIGQAPTLLTISTPNAVVGQTVVITGVNIGGATTVTVNGTVAPNFTVTPGTPDTLTLTIPPNATSGAITVNTPQGAASINVNVVQPPTITQLTPPDPNQANTSITLQGQNYLPVTEVSIGGVVLPATDYTIDNDGQIRITNVPTNPVLGPVKVTNAAGSAVASLTYKNVVNFLGNSNYFAYEPPYPNNTRPSIPVPNVANVYTEFVSGHGINVDSNGFIYVADFGHIIHKFRPDGSQAAGWPIGLKNSEGNVDSVVDNNVLGVRFGGSEDLANDANGNIYVADTNNDSIRKITVNQVTGLAVSVKTLAKVPGPEGIEVSRDGKVYVTGNNPPNPAGGASVTSSYVFRIDDLDTLPSAAEIAAFQRSDVSTRTSNVTIVAGGDKSPTRPTGTTTLPNTRFNHLEGLGIDGQGRIYVADVDNYLIRRIDEANNEVTIFADVDPCFGGLLGCTPTFESPKITVHEMRVDRQGNVFIPAVSTFSSVIFRDVGTPGSGVFVISPEGKFSFIAGDDDDSFAGMQDGNPLDGAKFASPRGVDFGPDGTLYVIDTAWGIRKIERYHPVSNLQIP